MRLLITFFIVCLCFYALVQTRWIWAVSRARKKGLYPEKGKATMFDVRRLILMKETELAVRVYCEIFKTNRKEAQKAVEEMEQGLQEKL